ncbi:Galactose-binding domain [Salix suchowensis]|nr:Galactose-binding domain [Salix suchowensis]
MSCTKFKFEHEDLNLLTEDFVEEQMLEKSKLQEDIVLRRQKKVLIRRTRQKYLEEAAIREEELRRELDREKAAEAEKEIERQRLLELECAKTRGAPTQS